MAANGDVMTAAVRIPGSPLVMQLSLAAGTPLVMQLSLAAGTMTVTGGGTRLSHSVNLWRKYYHNMIERYHVH